MRVATLAMLVATVCSSAVVANVSEIPPLNNETIVGVWEGFLNAPPGPITLFRMEITAKGDSYLVQITPRAPAHPGATYIVYKLVASDSKVAVGETETAHSTDDGIAMEMTGTPIRLHFHQVSPEPGLHDFWIKGIGVASPQQNFGLIQCTNLGKGIWFVKGTWTEELGKASEKADDAIKNVSK